MQPNQQFPAYLVTFTEEILNGKLHCLCNGILDSCSRIIYKTPHLDYEDTIYDEAYNISFHQKMENFIF